MKGTVWLAGIGLLLTLAAPLRAETGYSGWKQDPAADLETLPPERKRTISHPNRMLATGDTEDDLNYFHSQSRRMGVDIGAMVPFGDYQNDFGISPMMGVHLSWAAIPPFAFTIGWMRASAAQKTLASDAKLSVNSINVGAMATFSAKRIMPFVKIEAAFQFNDISFSDGRRITSGNDLTLTTVGANAGLGIDFVVGREISVGLDVTYHWAVPKKLTIGGTGSGEFDLGSPYATMGLRVNF